MPGHLITNLKCKGFMGQNINEDIAQKTIYKGKNTSGKSTRANLIAITLLGFSPFAADSSKRPNYIINDFGDGQKMVTEFTCGGAIFERKFTRSAKGSVSNIMRVNKTKVSKADFQVELFKSGDPRIVDISDFIQQSDAKKIETLFTIYPPGADLSNLDSDIEKSKKKISRLEESKRNDIGVIKKLTESKADVQLPAGTLAETQAAIASLTKGVLEAQNALKVAEVKNAEEVAAEKALTEQKNTQAMADQMMVENTASFSAEKEQAIADENKVFENNVHSNQSFANQGENIPKTFQGAQIVESIQKIITVMKKTSCSMCAAGMVAKMELKKYKGGE